MLLLILHYSFLIFTQANMTQQGYNNQQIHKQRSQIAFPLRLYAFSCSLALIISNATPSVFLLILRTLMSLPAKGMIIQHILEETRKKETKRKESDEEERNKRGGRVKEGGFFPSSLGAERQFSPLLALLPLFFNSFSVCPVVNHTMVPFLYSFFLPTIFHSYLQIQKKNYPLQPSHSSIPLPLPPPPNHRKLKKSSSWLRWRP